MLSIRPAQCIVQQQVHDATATLLAVLSDSDVQVVFELLLRSYTTNWLNMKFTSAMYRFHPNCTKPRAQLNLSLKAFGESHRYGKGTAIQQRNARQTHDLRCVDERLLVDKRTMTYNHAVPSNSCGNDVFKAHVRA